MPFADGLATNTKLKSFNLNQNSISDEGAVAIARSVKNFGL